VCVRPWELQVRFGMGRKFNMIVCTCGVRQLLLPDGTVERDSDSGDYSFATCMLNDLSVALTPMRGATCMTVAGAVMG
jgi:hypothetical protein